MPDKHHSFGQIPRLAQLTHALQYCHKRARILHRHPGILAFDPPGWLIHAASGDFKPSNIFLAEALRECICSMA